MKRCCLALMAGLLPLWTLADGTHAALPVPPTERTAQPGSGSDVETPPISASMAKLLEELQQGSIDDPRQTLERLQELEADRHPAFDVLEARIQEELDDRTAAGVAYTAALNKAPGFTIARLRFARLLLVNDQPGASLDLLQPLLGGNHLDALKLAGHAALSDNRPVTAESAFRTALLRDPAASDVRVGLVQALLLQDRTKEAASLAREQLKDQPHRMDLWRVVAAAEARQDSGERAAFVALETARRLGLLSTAGHADLADQAAALDLADQATAAYEVAFTGKETGRARRVRAAELLLYLDRVDDAERWLKQSLEEMDGAWEPPSRDELAAAYRLSARIAEARDNMDTAREWWKKALTQDPTDGRTLMRLARLHAETDPVQAKTWARRAQRNETWTRDALLFLCEMAVTEQRPREAINLLQQARAIRDAASLESYAARLREWAETLPNDAGR